MPPKPPKVDLQGGAKSSKPKKIPPPPACFNLEDILKFKEVFRSFDDDGIDRVKIGRLPTMLRTLGFNPTGEEVAELCRKFLEDDLVDMIELHEWYKMIECKKNWGDAPERDVYLAMGFLGHDNQERPTDIINIDTLQEELFNWGEVLNEAEWVDFPKVALKEKVFLYETGELQYLKFIEKMNAKDIRFNPEPINYYKLDPRQLAAMAKEKAWQEREEKKQKAQERHAREMAKRQRMIEQGLLQVEDAAKLPPPPDYKEPPDPYYLLKNYL